MYCETEATRPTRSPALLLSARRPFDMKDRSHCRSLPISFIGPFRVTHEIKGSQHKVRSEGYADVEGRTQGRRRGAKVAKTGAKTPKRGGLRISPHKSFRAPALFTSPDSTHLKQSLTYKESRKDGHTYVVLPLYSLELFYRPPDLTEAA